jgi:mono/diheme cytochrome c family protein
LAVALVLAALLGASRVAADPRTDYLLNCQGCHGPDGAGAPGAAPSFRDHVAKFLGVPGGREYLMRVPGVTQSELDDGRTAALLNWLMKEFSPAQLPRDFTPYTEADVAKHRHSTLTDVVGARRELMKAIEAVAGDGAAAAPKGTALSH